MRDEFVSRFDSASGELLDALRALRNQNASDVGLCESIDIAIENVSAFRAKAVTGTLVRRPESTLGFGKELGEWAPIEIANLARKIDKIYSDHVNSGLSR